MTTSGTGDARYEANEHDDRNQHAVGRRVGDERWEADYQHQPRGDLDGLESAWRRVMREEMTGLNSGYLDVDDGKTRPALDLQTSRGFGAVPESPEEPGQAPPRSKIGQGVASGLHDDQPSAPLLDAKETQPRSSNANAQRHHPPSGLPAELYNLWVRHSPRGDERQHSVPLEAASSTEQQPPTWGTDALPAAYGDANDQRPGGTQPFNLPPPQLLFPTTTPRYEPHRSALDPYGVSYMPSQPLTPIHNHPPVVNSPMIGPITRRLTPDDDNAVLPVVSASDMHASSLVHGPNQSLADQEIAMIQMQAPQTAETMIGLAAPTFLAGILRAPLEYPIEMGRIGEIDRQRGVVRTKGMLLSAEQNLPPAKLAVMTRSRFGDRIALSPRMLPPTNEAESATLRKTWLLPNAIGGGLEAFAEHSLTMRLILGALWLRMHFSRELVAVALHRAPSNLETAPELGDPAPRDFWDPTMPQGVAFGPLSWESPAMRRAAMLNGVHDGRASQPGGWQVWHSRYYSALFREIRNFFCDRLKLQAQTALYLGVDFEDVPRLGRDLRLAVIRDNPHKLPDAAWEEFIHDLAQANSVPSIFVRMHLDDPPWARSPNDTYWYIRGPSDYHAIIENILSESPQLRHWRRDVAYAWGLDVDRGEQRELTLWLANPLPLLVDMPSLAR